MNQEPDLEDLRQQDGELFLKRTWSKVQGKSNVAAECQRRHLGRCLEEHQGGGRFFEMFKMSCKVSSDVVRVQVG